MKSIVPSRKAAKVILAPLVLAVLAASIAAQQQPAFDSPPAYLKFEKRECAPELVCHNGLKGISAGRTCIEGVNHAEGTSVEHFNFTACTLDCIIAELRPSNACDLDKFGGGCVGDFVGRELWRSASALHPLQQAALRQLYDDLIALMNVRPDPGNARRDTKRYEQLGGDNKRTELKKQITEFVLTQMTPYALGCARKNGTAIPFENFTYPNDFAGIAGAEEGMATVVDGVDDFPGKDNLSMIVHETVIFKKTATAFVATPDIVAAAFMHEAVHWGQLRHGSAPFSGWLFSNGRITYPAHDAASALNELMAYDRCSASTFYKIVLSHADSDSLISFGRSANVKKFADAWKAMSDGPKKGLAKWAWGQSDGFMRRMMQFYPQDDEGVWGTLCAANDGTGPCRMVGSKR
jgi:hypothetical protein